MKTERTLSTRKHSLAITFLLGLVIVASSAARAQTFSVVHSFTGGSDGAGPLAGLVIDRSGNLYGTSSSGGSFGSGTVFKVDSSGHETALYNFTGGADGGSPQASLLLSGGNLYGTTNSGGASGAGTVFEVTLSGKETVLYTFTGKADGANPDASLIRDGAGNLYSTTFAGGTNGNGTVFKLLRPTVTGGAWTEQVLYSFGKGTDGANPVAGVTLKTGHLYGTTSAGGTYGYGTVFQLTPSKSGWTESILHQFEMQSDGGVPYAGIIVDHSGNLYGAATDGGAGGSNGGGTVFELTPSNGSWTFSVIYSLPGWGISGSFRNLLLASGKIYATTHCDGANSAGTVYELSLTGTTWTYTLLYDFSGNSDGRYAFSNLVMDKQGNLYGTTNVGGANGYGDVFKVKP
jgi:uncharacterized repeat protein (TIGR03803 family)